MSARADLYSASATSAACNLLGSTGTGHDMAYVATPAGQENSGHLQGIFVLPTAGSVTLECADGAGVNWGRARVDAIAVATAKLTAYAG